MNIFFFSLLFLDWNLDFFGFFFVTLLHNFGRLQNFFLCVAFLFFVVFRASGWLYWRQRVLMRHSEMIQQKLEKILVWRWLKKNCLLVFILNASFFLRNIGTVFRFYRVKLESISKFAFFFPHHGKTKAKQIYCKFLPKFDIAKGQIDGAVTRWNCLRWKNWSETDSNVAAWHLTLQQNCF